MPPLQEVDESQLLKLAQEGDAEAFGEIYERYARVIYRFLYSHLDNRLDAEDLVEEVFLRVWRSLPRYQEQGLPFAAFLFRVAHNALIDHYRRSGYARRQEPLEEETIIDRQADPAQVLVNSLQDQELRSLLHELRDDYRDVLVLRFLSELSPKETAQTMERSVGAVRVLQHRALAAMRSLLDRSQSEKTW